MPKRCAMLQKKLKEVESQLNQVFQHSPEVPYHNHLLSECIYRRFGFLRSLLSAEMESLPANSKPYHLNHIDQRLTELENAFRQWDEELRNSPGTKQHSDDDDDTDSKCSCTETCFNDDGGEEDDSDVILHACGNLKKLAMLKENLMEHVHEEKSMSNVIENDHWKTQKDLRSARRDSGKPRCTGVLARRAMMFGLAVLGGAMSWLIIGIFYIKPGMESFLLHPT